MKLRSYVFTFLIVFSIQNYNFAYQSKQEIMTEKIASKTIVLKELLKKAIEQIEAIDLAIEELAQGINTNNIKISNKENLKKYILNIRNLIQKTLNGEYFELGEQHIFSILKISRIILAHLNISVESGFKELASFNESTIIENSIETKDINTEVVELILKENDTELKLFKKKFPSVNLTKFNTFIKEAEKTVAYYNLFTIARRFLPYIGIGLYLYTLENKAVSGTGSVNKASVPRILNAPLSFLKNTIDVKIEPILTISIGAIAGPIVKKDLTDLKDWTTRKFKKTYASLKGESIADDLPLKKSKITFDDIIGCENIKSRFDKVITYFKSKNLLELLGTSIPKGYLFAGSVEQAEKLAQGLAGEITKVIEKPRGDEFCGFKTIHASELARKKLSEVISEIEKSNPCMSSIPYIIIINELDWLVRHSVSTEIWSEITDTVSKTVNNPRKNILIIATTTDIKVLQPVVKDLTNFGITLHLGTPSLKDRKEFFKKELTNACIDPSKFDLEALGKQTDNCTFDQIEKVIKNSFGRAHIQNKKLEQKDIEESINELIYNIINDKESLDESQKEFLSAHFAGKTIAHLLCIKNIQLTRVTILPRIVNKKIIYGSLFKANVPETMTTTKDDIEKEALVELAGIQAQKLLLSKVSYTILSDTSERTFELAKSIVFEGISEDSICKKDKQEKLSEAKQLVEQWNNKVQELLQNNIKSLENIYTKLKSKMTLDALDIENLIE